MKQLMRQLQLQLPLLRRDLCFLRHLGQFAASARRDRN
jgi:hypothetical protein